MLYVNVSFSLLCLCVSSLCYLSSPCNYIVYCYEPIVCFDSAQFDALLDNLSAFIVYVHLLYFASINLLYYILKKVKFGLKAWYILLSNKNGSLAKATTFIYITAIFQLTATYDFQFGISTKCQQHSNIFTEAHILVYK